ncbi:aminotransferase class V-fold PLP-dependent enzyme [Cellulomonas chengniuliangii]|uniref:Aminotransferase class V-fold PLP-dependent enzyme n=1 Tax=Cellulomonas chengniuliangii TaxID=2968084 RepID=A0ABY5KYT0_9CELL|nr:aminotransferase class V-fold PLP-dependent enzyme [Cellulomonas chengniuliangii]MCC2307646.1 aminotransferase class V-fold PLP-dependent enzyme [Cellulomonas chengniuliangii]MCC2318754.1 aminotransferase class V-fold PLP-dependent enzyme [Cellulomonas chengniuliangii]UUI75589.1 aminotransferase class V-fold PLP-dependent enzyme [Cellulomonas chengniuliangii]
MKSLATESISCLDEAASTEHLPLLAVAGAATQVPLVDGTSRTYANLDYAASAPALERVATRVAEVLPLYASVHRGAGYLSQVSTALYEASRQAVARFVGAREDDVTIITRNTTDSLNLLAGVVPAAPDGTPGRVLVLDVEHHANLLPWTHGLGLDATVLAIADTVAGTLDAIAVELAARPYALVTVTGASNVTGEALPIGDVVRIAHAAGARVAVDGAQLIPHRRFSLEDSGVDYLAFSGHKAYAPFGAGVLVGRRDWLDVGTPYLAGGGAVRDVRTDRTLWQPAPARHEAGSPNVIGAVALAEACDALAALPDGALAAHEEVLRARLVEGLETLDGVEVVRIWPDSHDPVGVVTFTVAGHDPGLVAAFLAAEYGIGVRDGRFCAHPLLSRLGASSGAIRASVGVGTPGEAVDRLIAGLAAYLKAGPRARYEVVDGCWTVVDDTRPLLAVQGLDSLTATAAQACGPAVD